MKTQQKEDKELEELKKDQALKADQKNEQEERNDDEEERSGVIPEGMDFRKFIGCGG